MRIVVVGARGQLATAVAHACTPAHEVITFTRAELDAADAAAVAEAIRRTQPDAIVNGVAYNDVDGAEDHPLDALNANAFAVRALARAAQQVGAALVHYSTDFVFDGRASEPYREDQPVNPRGVYAASKMLGEWFAMDAPRAYVQQPDRALWNFAFVAVPIAVLALAESSNVLCWLFVVCYGVGNLRLGVSQPPFFLAFRAAMIAIAMGVAVLASITSLKRERPADT